MFTKLTTSMVVEYIKAHEPFPQLYKTLICSNDSRHRLRGCGDFGIMISVALVMHAQLGEANRPCAGQISLG